MKNNNGMSLIIKTVTRLSVWLILLYGAYLIIHGHLTPGGGFGGGVIISLAFVNVMIAYGGEFTKKWLKIERIKDYESVSIILFLILGLLGIFMGTAFLANFLMKGELFQLLSGGTIPLYNILIGIKVGASLFIVVWLLSELKIKKEDQR
jgi:multicomponent Na+:H+ antiporter subunit B